MRKKKAYAEERARMLPIEIAYDDDTEYEMDDEAAYQLYKQSLAAAEGRAVCEDSSDRYSNEGRNKRISVPNASYISSSEAYNRYSSVISDAKLGENWESADIIRAAKENHLIEKQMEAHGYNVTDNPSDMRNEFDAVLLKNGRIYGRYHHKNGTKLDVNGVMDSDDNIIIKLGHGNDVSYWVLKKTETDGNIITYSATWGKKEKPSEVKIRYTLP